MPSPDIRLRFYFLFLLGSLLAAAIAEAASVATQLAPTKTTEAALLRTRSPGAYTAIVRGANGRSGIAVVEAYNLP